MLACNLEEVHKKDINAAVTVWEGFSDVEFSLALKDEPDSQGGSMQ